MTFLGAALMSCPRLSPSVQCLPACPVVPHRTSAPGSREGSPDETTKKHRLHIYELQESTGEVWQWHNSGTHIFHTPSVSICDTCTHTRMLSNNNNLLLFFFLGWDLVTWTSSERGLDQSKQAGRPKNQRGPHRFVYRRQRSSDGGGKYQHHQIYCFSLTRDRFKCVEILCVFI